MAARKPPTTVRSVDDPAAAASRPLLVVVGAGHFGTYPVADDAAITLGRDATCTIALAHDKVSRRHLVMRAEGGAITVEDAGSTNGVVIGGRRLAAGEQARLHPGDSFQVGPYNVLVVALDGDVSPAGPSRGAVTVTDPTVAGASPLVARLARSTASILIQGETGAGKEVLARTIHALSERAGPFVGINCAALSEPLLENELFGHERGAFTGAAEAKPGLLETAPAGTVFLDEIGELSTTLQAKLLRALETREVTRVGGLKHIALDVRFLTATHRDLAADVVSGKFRRDLYYRINGVTLRLPPLRDRRAAIPDLARAFVAEAAAAAGRPAPRLGIDAIGKLARHDWPGNVRELRAVIERALLVGAGDEIGARAILIDAAPADDGEEHAEFLEVARRHRGNVTNIAADLGTSRSQVRRLAKRLAIDLERLRRD